MTHDPANQTPPDSDNDGIDRRNFLSCMAWAGTGALWLMKGGILESYSLSRLSSLKHKDVRADLSFVQISDSHIGFNKPANTDVVGTLQAAIDEINALPSAPAFMLHTGDITHLSKPEEFDTVQQMLKRRHGTGRLLRARRARRARRQRQAVPRALRQGHARARGWYSFDQNGVHFVGLVNVHEPEGRRPGQPRRRAAGVAGERREASVEQHAHRRLRAHPAVDASIPSGAGALLTARRRSPI